MRNSNATTHGLFRNFLPDDESIFDAANSVSPIDILCEHILIKFTAIVRSQKIMFVRNQEDETKVLTKYAEGQFGDTEEWEYQHAWDKQATFLNAQSRAMSTLTSMIVKYEEMCRLGWADEEQQLRLQKLKLEVDKLENGDEDSDDLLIEDWVNGVMDVEEE